MGIHEFFQKNQITRKTLDDATIEQRRARSIIDDQPYYDVYYRTNLDFLLECVDRDINEYLYDIVLAEIQGAKDLFEPCCGSGLFGCGIASETGARYLGVDINALAIAKARKLAEKNSLRNTVFEIADVFEYRSRHEVVVGKCVANDSFLRPDRAMIGALTNISDRIILIQPLNKLFSLAKASVMTYEEIFSSYGYKFNVCSEFIKSPATDAYMVVIKAEK